MKTLNRIPAVFLSLVIVCYLSGNSLAEQPWIVPPMELNEETAERLQYLTAVESYEEALELTLQVAEQNKGTSLEARGWLSAELLYRSLNQPDLQRQMLERTISEYPGSRFEVQARLGLIRLEHGYYLSGSQHIEFRNQVAVDVGAPTLDDIVNDTNAAIEKGSSLHPEIRQASSEIYTMMDILLKIGEVEKALALAKFGRAVIDPVMTYVYPSDNRFSLEQANILAQTNNVDRKLFFETPGVPQFEILSPLDGAILPNPIQIKLRLSSGNFRHTQIDLDRMRIKIDGEDVKHEFRVNPIVNQGLDENTDFEVIELSLSKELQRGRHDIEISVAAQNSLNDPPSGPNKIEKSWIFYADSDLPPGPITLSASQDSLISKRNLHQNDGANEVLTLENIQGDVARSLVGFDLADANLSGLTRATLVLTIDPSQHADGWGNGETVSVQALTAGWTEGNGQSFGLKRPLGTGSGATWFSPADPDIGNTVADSANGWDGGLAAAVAATAPPVLVSNHAVGQLEFDVTTDLINGNGQYGWLIKKDLERRGSKVSFYSKEGAGKIGDLELAPKLVLEYGSSVSSTLREESLVSLFFAIAEVVYRNPALNLLSTAARHIQV